MKRSAAPRRFRAGGGRACAAARGGREGSSRRSWSRCRRCAARPREPARPAGARRGQEGRSRSVTWPPSPRSRSWRGSSAAAARFAFSAGRRRGVAAGVDVDCDQRPRRLDRHRALAERHQRPAQRLDLLPDAGVGERASRASRRRSPASRQSRSASAAAPGAGRSRAGGPAAGASAVPVGAERGDLGRDLGVVAPRGGGAQDEARGSARRRPSPPRPARRAPSRRSASRRPRAMFGPGASGVRIAVRPLRRSRAVTGGALPGSAQPATCTSSGRPGAGRRWPRRKPVCPPPRSTMAPPRPFIGRPGTAR